MASAIGSVSFAEGALGEAGLAEGAEHVGVLCFQIIETTKPSQLVQASLHLATQLDWDLVPPRFASRIALLGQSPLAE